MKQVNSPFVFIYFLEYIFVVSCGFFYDSSLSSQLSLRTWFCLFSYVGYVVAFLGKPSNLWFIEFEYQFANKTVASLTDPQIMVFL